MIAVCLIGFLAWPSSAVVSPPQDAQDVMKARLRSLKEGEDPAPILRAMRLDCTRTDDDPKEVKKYVSRFLREDAGIRSAAYCAALGTRALELELVTRAEILALAGDDRPALRETGLWTLGVLRESWPEAPGLLEAGLSAPSPAIRKTSVWALTVAAAEDPVTLLVAGSDARQEADDGSVPASTRAFRLFLSRMGQPLGEDGPADPEVWASALGTDGPLGSYARDLHPRPAPERAVAALPRIALLLDDEERDVRCAALWGLAWLAADSGSFATKLTELLDDPDPLVATAALRVFSRMGLAAEPAAERLRQFATGTPEQRELALLARIRAGVEIPVPELVECLAAEQPLIVVVATQELALRTPPPPNAFSPLADSFLALDYLAARALVRYGERSLPPFVEALEEGPLDLRGVAIVALGELGELAAPTRSRLEAVVTAGESEEADEDARTLASAAARSLQLIDG